MDSLSDQPALIAGLAVVTVLFLSALAVGMVVFRKVRKNKAKVNHQKMAHFFENRSIFSRLSKSIYEATYDTSVDK